VVHQSSSREVKSTVLDEFTSEMCPEATGDDDHKPSQFSQVKPSPSTSSTEIVESHDQGRKFYIYQRNNYDLNKFDLIRKDLTPKIPQNPKWVADI
jgi:hypothetical protein